jgi:hypothetical protein
VVGGAASLLRGMASVEGDAATEAPRAAMESGVAATEEGGTSRTQHQLPAG